MARLTTLTGTQPVGLDMAALFQPDASADFGQLLQRRAALLRGARGIYGPELPVKPFTAAEVQQGAALLDGLDAGQKETFIGTVRRAFASDPEAYDSAMSQFGATHPVLSFVARHAGPPPDGEARSPQLELQQKRITAQILQGEQLIRTPPKERGHAFYVPTEAEIRTHLDVGIAGEPGGTPETEVERRTVQQAVRAAYVADAYQHGDSTGALDLHRLHLAVATVTALTHGIMVWRHATTVEGEADDGGDAAAEPDPPMLPPGFTIRRLE